MAKSDLVQRVSDSVHKRISDSLSAGKIPAKVQGQVAERSTGPGIDILVEVVDVDHINDAETELRKSLTIVFRRWISKQAGEKPRLVLKAVLPPESLPQRWDHLKNPPRTFMLTVQATLQESEAQEVETLQFPAEVPSVALVMKGGGIKGLAYIGALEVLWEHYHFERYVGTSAGAITAILLGAGKTPEQLKTVLKDKNFRDFFDAPWYHWPLNLLFRRGLHPAFTFKKWMDQQLASPTEMTLDKLPHRVTVFACRQGKDALRFDSNMRDPAVSASHAARCSMSIPIVFIPQSDQGYRTYDGGMQNNYPLKKTPRGRPKCPVHRLVLGIGNLRSKA